MTRAGTIPLSDIARIQIYDKKKRNSKSGLTSILDETGGTFVMGGPIFLKTFKACCHLSVDGKVMCDPGYQAWCISWNTPEDFCVEPVSATLENKANYVECVHLIIDGKTIDPIHCGSDMKYASNREAIGVKDGQLAYYATEDNLTPEELRDILYAAGWSDAIMMDGGGSACFLDENGDGFAGDGRFMPFYIVVTLKAKTQDPKEESPMFKIALGAGHGINTAGKRCLKALDPNETREWWLNDRICDYVESYLKEYEGYSLLRLDDSDDGKENPALETRVQKANNFGADFYLSVHHNAGVNGGSGGGIMAFTCPGAQAASVAWRNALYDALIKHTGLKGNRSNPKAEGEYYVLKNTKMPAVLLELGFMDSKTDVPVILTDKYAQQCARAIVEVLVAHGKLTKKADVLYKVQVGAFSKKENADKLVADLKAKGFPAFVVSEK